MENDRQRGDALRSVNDLLGERFFVPKYQRGYRWREGQVRDLLDDIDAFNPGGDGRGWYCLQPLVVHRGMEAEGWRLVDGQQRLTTIKLILTWLDRHYVEELCKQLSSSTQETQGIDQLILAWLDRRDVEGLRRIFSLTYETRGSDKDWLAVLDDEEAARRNIDYWHIRQAWQCICEWFGERGEAFDTYAFSSKLLHRCRFIWYDTGQGGTDNDNEEDVFIRLNDGKIPLTSAELVKALFLNSSNFAGSGDSEAIRLRQLEISSQWDMMEEALADDAFWAFINGRDNKMRPRIGYILDIMAGKTDGKGDDDYFTYRHFQRRFDDNERSGDDKRAFVNQLWREVHDTFLALREWYGYKRYYHLAGYLLNTGCVRVGDLLDAYMNCEKDRFAAILDTDVSKNIDWDGDEEITYGDPRLRRILLLHNVVTMMQQDNETARLPFGDFIAGGNHDIEHIHPQNPKEPDTPAKRQAWLKAQRPYVDDALAARIDSFDDWEDGKAFGKLCGDIRAYFANDLEEDETDGLSNLCLLQARLNRSYHNSFFPDKRAKILLADQEGTFIPACTKRVFYKYYTTEPQGMTFWDRGDREAYLANIKETLKPYLKKKNHEIQ